MSIYALVMKHLKQMSQKKPAYEPFRGSISGRLGKMRIAGDKRPTLKELTSMEGAASGVIGP